MNVTEKQARAVIYHSKNLIKSRTYVRFCYTAVKISEETLQFSMINEFVNMRYVMYTSLVKVQRLFLLLTA